MIIYTKAIGTKLISFIHNKNVLKVVFDFFPLLASKRVNILEQITDFWFDQTDNDIAFPNTLEFPNALAFPNALVFPNALAFPNYVTYSMSLIYDIMIYIN